MSPPARINPMKITKLGVEEQDSEIARYWQTGVITVAKRTGPDREIRVGRWINTDGSVCYDDEQLWCIEQDAAEVLNALHDTDEYVWDDGEHTSQIIAMSQWLREAWSSVEIPE